MPQVGQFRELFGALVQQHKEEQAGGVVTAGDATMMPRGLLGLKGWFYHLVIEHGPVEIVDFPMKNGDVP